MSQKSKLSAVFEAIKDEPAQAVQTNTASEDAVASIQVQSIELSRIYVNPTQFRKYFDPDEQAKLRNSIQQNGFQGSILLRPLPESLRAEADPNCDFELIYGESRYRAVKDLGYDTIPAEVKELTDQQTRRIRLDENLVRNNLNPLEEVEGVLEVAADELGISTRKVISLLDEVVNNAQRKKELKSDIALQAEKLEAVLEYYKKGSLTGFRSKFRKLQRLPEDIQTAIREQLSWSKAVEIAPVKDAEIRGKLLRWTIKDNPSVAQIRKKRRELLQATTPEAGTDTNDNSLKLRFYRGLTKISKSEEWANPKSTERLERLIQEIEDIFQTKIS